MRRSLALLVLSLTACAGGPEDLERYPPPETSPYVLPYPPGFSFLCVQGNNGALSHTGVEEFAWDFLMPVGSPVTAARAGVVLEVKHDSSWIGRACWNNLVRILHDDGTVATYLHLDTWSARVRTGQRVEQRQAIARSGWNGYAALPHLHFDVSRDGEAVPLTFQDVTRDRGIPRTFSSYRAGLASTRGGAGPD